MIDMQIVFTPQTLRKLRTDGGLTIQNLADISGVSAGSIFNIETGKGSPSLNKLEKLADALNVTWVIKPKK